MQIHSGSPSLTLSCEVIPKLPRKDNKTSCMTGLVCNSISFRHPSHRQSRDSHTLPHPAPAVTAPRVSHISFVLPCFPSGEQESRQKSLETFTGIVCVILRRQTKGIYQRDRGIFGNHHCTATWDLQPHSSQGVFPRACYQEHNFQNEIK